MPDSKLNDDRMARQIQSELNPALCREFLNPGFVKNRIKWCKKQREHDGLDEARGISRGEQVFWDCAHGQGKYYFHLVDLGKTPVMHEKKAWGRGLYQYGKVQLPSPLVEVVSEFNFPFLMDYCATFAGWLPTKREVEAICRRACLLWAHEEFRLMPDSLNKHEIAVGTSAISNVGVLQFDWELCPLF
ncbi:unnamed protein product [Symbiodinium sp. CCMP2592]|nr:unnamed protein product [Symbiodinium sp. CCMP2592]